MGGTDDQRELTARQLFDVVWCALTEVIGSAATASLMKRSARRATRAGADLEGLTISRQSIDCTYDVPASWHERGPASIEQLRRLVAELCDLTGQLTGPVLVRRLEDRVELQSANLFRKGDST